ncbi:MMPL family transporter [Providencia alcalifaciens]|uniref:MMPL family transporter n=1 Tax=Providencia alcalifaciens TaxID=126385 RepID=UPI002B05C611|nr:MMPL family transporter [Providencia alcalifaciens]
MIRLNTHWLSQLWLLVCVALAAALFWLLPHARIASSVMALLPTQAISQASPAISDGFLTRLDRQLVWLVSPSGGEHPDAQNDEAVAHWLNQLQKQTFLDSINGPVNDDQQKAWGKFYYQHRNALLDDATRARLQQGHQQADWIISQLFSTFSGISGLELTNDPMLLVRGSQLALQKMGSKFSLHNGWLTVIDENGRRWYMLHGELDSSASELKQAQKIAGTLAQLQRDWEKQYPDGQILSRGSLYYSDNASQQAESDMSRLGTITILGVFLLIIGIFRSIRPLFLCLLSVTVGALGGVVSTLLVFGEIHILTLVMSMSIIGISVDYAIYYLIERMVYGQQDSPQQSLIKVRSALLLALGTTVSAYLIMMLAPFPGIRQLALFASVGLTCACLTVILFFPFLVRGLPNNPVPFSMLLLRWLGVWRHNKTLKFGLSGCAIVISAIGISQLKVNDDIAALQALPTHLVEQDQRISQLTGQHSDQTWYLISGASQEQALQRLENFEPQLQGAQQQGAFHDFQRIPFYSQQRQTENAKLVNDAAPYILNKLQETGVDVAEINIQPMNVTLDTWLASPVSQGWRLMLLTLPSGETGILLPVNGVKDKVMLAQLAADNEGVSWIARKAQFDELFSHYRMVLTWLIGVALAFVVVTYLFREGIKHGLICILPTLFSLSVALGVLGLSGMPLNLFSLLALILVLGIGINYSIFFSNPKGTAVTSLLAVTVALCTTLLTLGMLVMSSTPAIQGFGLTLCVGIFSAWLFSPLTLTKKKKKTRGKSK